MSNGETEVEREQDGGKRNQGTGIYTWRNGGVVEEGEEEGKRSDDEKERCGSFALKREKANIGSRKGLQGAAYG